MNEDYNNTGAEYMVYCSRCGSEIKNNSRYCMKCGNLNPDHPANQNYSNLIKKTQKQGFNIKGSLFSVVNTNEVTAKNNETIGISSDPGGFNLCFLLNFLIYLLLAGAVGVYFYFTNDQDIIGFISSNVGYVLLSMTVFFFFSYAWEQIFIKVNLPWWSSLVPIYNFYLLAGVIFNGKRVYKLVALIPIVGQFYSLYLLYKLGEGFKVSGISMVLFFPFVMPSVAYGGNSYNNVRYVSSTTATGSEFKKKRTFATFCIIIAIASLASIGFTTISQLNGNLGDVNAAYIISVSNTVSSGTIKKVKAKNYSCDFDAPVFYFYYEDVADYFDIPLALVHDKTSAYVKVVSSDIVGEYYYYISISDGKYGFDETLYSEVSNDTVVAYPRLKKTWDNGNTCR